MAKDSTNLRDLKLNPKYNPFLKATNPVPTKNGLVATKMSTDLVDPRTGEQHTHALIHKIKEVDDQHFVKVFAEGVKKAFELNRTEARIFQKILDVYGAEKMTGGYADSITLCWFDDGLNGEKINMSEKTFKRGMVGLLKKEFILPKTRDQFWVNPSLFFKGDRVAFVTEYRRTQKSEQAKLEDEGQQRLID
jgi:hypothetical protein